MATAMGNQSANNLADPVLLQKIDKFFELGIGEYVALPQLLVVGDQSSGKSSVLEGLTGIPYPRESGLCTRFATQITFRRSPATKIAVSIIPAQNSLSDYAEKLRAWRKDDLVSLELQTFADILKEVQELMGLGQANGGGDKKTFADDVLKIEICGPGQEHLSVIDVPGIFKKSTPGVTTKADMAMVRNMVTTYMRNPRSVILAVIPANVDIATQEILEMAEDLDGKGERTLGVLTKPDLVDKGAEAAVINIIEGRSHTLNLGWCIVKNPGQQALANSLSDVAANDRHDTEKAFFRSERPWSDLSKDRVGIEALRSRLVEILADMIKREFPRVKAEINGKLKLCKQRLDALGPSRATRDQQYKCLLDLATQYQNITSLALKAHYGGDDVFETTPSLKLATAIVSRNTAFSDDVWRRGHAMNFQKDKDAKETIPSSAPIQFGSPSPFAGQVPTFGMNDLAPKSDNPVVQGQTPMNTPFGCIDIKSTNAAVKPPTNTPLTFINDAKSTNPMVKSLTNTPRGFGNDVKSTNAAVKGPTNTPHGFINDVKSTNSMVKSPANTPHNFGNDAQSVNSVVKTPTNMPHEFSKDAKSTNLTVKAPMDSPYGLGNNVRSVRYEKTHPDLEDIMQDDLQILPPKIFGIKQWLESVYKSSRGFEMGTFDASLLPIIWKKQSANWEALALGYVNDIVSLVHSFTVDLLGKICKDSRARQALNSVLLDQLIDRYKKSIDHTKFLLTIERSGTPMTMNHYFADNLQKSRSARMKATMEKMATWDPNQGKVVKLDAILNQGVNTGSNLQHTVDDLHDILHSYYKVARKRFVDIVCMQVADYFLVTGHDAPIKVFSPKFVSELTDEQLAAIAGEDLLSKRKREDLTRKIENLEIGKKIALS